MKRGRPKKKLEDIKTSELKKIAATEFQLLRRLECADDRGYCVCCTCGATSKYNENMQGGHYVGRSVNLYLLDPLNVHPQCSWCNGMGKGMPDHYYVFLCGKYGEEAADTLLQARKRKNGIKTHKLTKPFLIDFIQETRAKIRKEKERVGAF